MAEFITEIARASANQHAGGSDADHYKVPVYEWFGESPNYSYPPAFYPDLGDRATEQWLNNVSTPGDYVTKLDPLWWTPDQPNADNTGFNIKKPSTTQARQINVRVDGGIGHWMPAPIFRSFSFYWDNPVNANANWRVYCPGLVLRHWETNEEKIWTAGWQDGNWGQGGRLKRLTNEAKAYPVNNLGPDWYIYGAIFNCRSNSTSGAQSPQSYFRDYRLGWYNKLPSGSYNLIIPDKMSWDDFRAQKAAGQVSFYSLNKPCREVNKVSNGNNCPRGNSTKMRARKSSSGAITYLQWEDPDYGNYVSAGDTVYVNGNPYVVDSVNVSYCDDPRWPTTQLTIKSNIPGVDVAGTNITISLCAP